MSCYNVKDLKRLKIGELLAIATDRSDCVPPKKRTKAQLIDHICLQQQPHLQQPHPPIPSVTLTNDEPTISFSDPSVCYRRLSDTDLGAIPQITFSNIYAYFTASSSDCEASCKAIDRAVKHTSAGHVNSVSWASIVS
jgi:hypothetical protein